MLSKHLRHYQGRALTHNARASEFFRNLSQGLKRPRKRVEDCDQSRLGTTKINGLDAGLKASSTKNASFFRGLWSRALSKLIL